MSTLGAQALRRIDRVCTSFESAWKAGQQPQIEQFCSDSDSTPLDAQESTILFRELMLLELEYRQRHGEQPSADEYLRRFPDRSDVVGQVWEGQRADADGFLPEISGYEVLRRIGRGGMAVVYLARDRRLGRLVALKLISAADPADPLVSRFRAEAHAVARLQHPNIVQIYEIGEHAGRPYLALEYVSGGSLADWIAGNPRPAHEAARLVEILARAVHAAHQHGVVHRDLKPANVLLHTDEQGKSNPKITDFGLVKFIDEADTRQTQSGVVVGTASYMAPEQAAMQRADIGPAADIYALGAILYELITARPPFKAATVLETALLVRSRDPVSPRQLQPSTPRDLETVCLKCLEKDPARRYASAQELADDLRRFISGEPVRARPVGSIERAWRWSRRNPAIAGLAASIGVVLVLGTVISSYFAYQSDRRAKENLRLASEAESKRQQAETVSQYLVNAFRSPDPERDGRAITIAEVLDRAAAQLHKDFPNQPVTEAELAAALGQTYLSLGMSKQAVELLQRSRDLMQAHAAPDDWRAIATLHLLARAHIAAGQIEQALPLAQQALQRLRAAVGEDHPETMQSINTLANANEELGRFKEAADLHERTLVWARKTLGESDPQTLTAMNNLAHVYTQLGQVDRAVPLYEQALAEFRAKFGSDHFYTLAAMNNLASAYSSLGQSDRAIEMLQQVLDGARRLLGEDHPKTITTLANLARAYREAKRFDEALPLVQEAYEQRRAKLGEDHPATLNTLGSLADTYSAAGRSAQALPLYEQLYHQRLAKLGAEHPDTLLSMNGLGRTYHLNGRPKDAESLLRSCLEIRRRIEPDDWRTFDAQVLLGGVLLDLKQLNEGEAMLVQGYEGMMARRAQIPLENQARLRYALESMVRLYELSSKPDQAAAWRAKLLAWSNEQGAATAQK